MRPILKPGTFLRPWLVAFCLGLPAFGLAVTPGPSDPNYTGPSAPTVVLPDVALPEGKEFVHPGLLQGQADIDFIRARLQAREEPWTKALKALAAVSYCRKDYKPQAVAEVDAAGKSRGVLMWDGTGAYGDALLWSLTGDRAYADKAIEILDAHASTLRAIVGGSDESKLLAGFTGCKFASAAELLLHCRQPDGTTADWDPAAAERCKTMLKTVFYPLIRDFKPEFNGNWDASMVNTMLCIGVLCDDHAMFNRALDYYLHGKGHGSISHYIFEGGQTQETARDQSHVQLGLGALASACEIAAKQGLDLYGMADNRLAAGFEYTAKFLCGEDVEPVPASGLPASPRGRERPFPIYEIAYQHYAVEKGLPMPYTERILKKSRPEGFDLIVLPAWGTLTLYRGPALP